MADPLDLVGPFLFPVVLFALGLLGYGVLLALGRAGVLDAEEPTPDDDNRAPGDTVDGRRDERSDRRDGPRRR